MATAHGSFSRGLTIPPGSHGTPGSFGRMFPDLPARKATGLEMAKRFGAPGGLMDGGQTTDDQQNRGFPAGFTFLGQFIDHDLTLDASSSFDRHAEPNGLVDFRSPRLDMDSVYGLGPVASGHLYDPASHGTKLVLSPDAVDQARTMHDVALIGDPRNDENMLLAQFHVAMIKFHNSIVDLLRDGKVTDALGEKLAPKPPDEPATQQPGATLDQLLDVDNYYNDVLDKAQQLARWHYQWIIVHQFLPTIADGAVVRDVERNGPRFFRPGSRPFIPVEFAVAAYRFGHPTIRSSYRVNENFTGKIFPDDPEAPVTPRSDLRGGPVDAEHAIDWKLFFDVGQRGSPQFAKRIDATLNSQLLDLPVSAVPGAKEGALARPVASLVVRNLLRSEAQGLPSGQDVARKIGEVALTDEQLGTEGPIYLWYYVLKEAEVLAKGRHLGPVGSRLVAEVLIGLLDADPTSYRSAFPAWKPTLGAKGGDFGVADLLRTAGVLDDK